MQTDKKKAFSKFLSGSTDECLVQKCRQTADKDAVGCRCLDASLPLTFFRLLLPEKKERMEPLGLSQDPFIASAGTEQPPLL